MGRIPGRKAFAQGLNLTIDITGWKIEEEALKMTDKTEKAKGHDKRSVGQSAVEGLVVELLIIAGNNPKGILALAANDIEKSFCKYPEEFKEEWGVEGYKYKLTLQIEKVL